MRFSGLRQATVHSNLTKTEYLDWQATYPTNICWLPRHLSAGPTMLPKLRALRWKSSPMHSQWQRTEHMPDLLHETAGRIKTPTPVRAAAQPEVSCHLSNATTAASYEGNHGHRLVTAPLAKNLEPTT